MAKAPTDLASAVHDVAGTRRKRSPKRPYSLPKTRQGTKGVLIHVPADMARALRHLAVDRDITMQALGIEAFRQILDRNRDESS